jgi:glutathione peroxidase
MYYMQRLLYTAILLTIFSFRYVDDIYSLALHSIDGKKIDLASYKGKKMLFVICPLKVGDTAVTIQELNAFQAKYEKTVAVIGILAAEEGYKKSMDADLRKLFKGHQSNFLLAEGMNVRKAAGGEQASLFQWLTNKSKNSHFDQDVQGIGQKFFVDEQGELYAVLGAQIRLSNPVIERVLARQIPKKPINQSKP